MSQNQNLLNNNKGQGLVEYLIIVALMGVAAIGVVRLLNHTTRAKFSESINALQGKPPKKGIEIEAVNETHFKKRDLGDFMNGASSSK